MRNLNHERPDHRRRAIRRAGRNPIKHLNLAPELLRLENADPDPSVRDAARKVLDSWAANKTIATSGLLRSSSIRQAFIRIQGRNTAGRP
ncbi:hypothetical protein [Longimicrobium sp.]|uniref:hypothetical protein n=1 Tax=Longimicrobium sp. TaxID=2029185 RepID=UPI003B3ACF33